MRKGAPLHNMDRSYKSAVQILNSRRRLGRPTTEAERSLPSPSQLPSGKSHTDHRGVPSVTGMSQWLREIGHSSTDIDNLNIVHVAGTKGKGSTCAFIESFLRSYGHWTGFPSKTGLYTSPHLIYPEERIRINYQPITKERFAQYFFEVWDVLSNNDSGMKSVPRYLQLAALVSFHAFIREGVDAMVVETHHGGEYDATNFIEHPIATVITPLGMDHVKELGPTIENIAWHKAGIMKRGSLAFSAPQEHSAAEVLRHRAAEKGVDIQFVDCPEDIPVKAQELKPDVQRMNCSVALAVVRSFLKSKAPPPIMPLTDEVVNKGIDQFVWPGRFQLINEGPYQWYLDGAHNEMSTVKAAEWFIESSNEELYVFFPSGVKVAHLDPACRGKRILIFSQVSAARDSTTVLECLAIALRSTRIDHVIFTTYDPQQIFDVSTILSSNPVDLDRELFTSIWQRYQPNSTVSYEPGVTAALDAAREIGRRAGSMQTLITGSLHLAGAVLFSFSNRETV